MKPFVRSLGIWLIVGLAVVVLFNLVPLPTEHRQAIISWLPLVLVLAACYVTSWYLQQHHSTAQNSKLAETYDKLHADNEAIIALLTQIRDQRVQAAAAQIKPVAA